MYHLFSVDDHIIEPADVWSSRVPAKFKGCGAAERQQPAE
jgi:hypothetical protein